MCERVFTNTEENSKIILECAFCNTSRHSFSNYCCRCLCCLMFFQLSFRSCLCICAHFNSILFIASLSFFFFIQFVHVNVSMKLYFFFKTVDYLCTVLIVLSWIYILCYVSVAQPNIVFFFACSFIHSILCNCLLNLFPSFSFIGIPDVYYIWPVCVCFRFFIDLDKWLAFYIGLFLRHFSLHIRVLYVLQSIFCLIPMILSTKHHSSTTITTADNVVRK